MSQTYEFYTARAEEAAADAEAATLDNVRDRALRSEATWRALAHQASAVATQREKIEREKAAQRAAAAAEATDLQDAENPSPEIACTA